MSERPARNEWRVLGATVRGTSHYRTGAPNQDAIRRMPEYGTGCPALLSVADGHGSAGSIRSHVGSDMATATAIEVMQELIEKRRAEPDPAAAQRKAERGLPREIVRRWWQRVADDLSKSPFSSFELMRLENEAGADTRRNVALNPASAYGSTLLAALVTESFLLYAQLGDGDILAVSDKGEVHRPIPKDARLMGNETTSLCVPAAWDEMRVLFEPRPDPPPALILVSSDGYANSFKDDGAFRQIGSDILEMIRADGLIRVQYEMERWLREASEAGSGDDITLGVICRVDAVE